MNLIAGLSDVVGRFDLFLLDQFGVLHDGRDPYPRANETLRLLAEHGKRAILISNSGKRAAFNIERMSRMGIPRDLYGELVSSGEVAWHILRKEAAAEQSDRPRRCHMITTADGDSPIEGLNITLTESAQQADFILLAGSQSHRFDEDHYRRMLAPAAARGVPCLCTNPDKIALAGADRVFGPGRIAEIYQELGGSVRWIGKPYPEIYRHAMTLAPGIDPGRVLCVGDSIEHDIAGASKAGFASLLVRQGILRDLDEDQLTALAARHDATPDYVMFEFSP